MIKCQVVSTMNWFNSPVSQTHKNAPVMKNYAKLDHKMSLLSDILDLVKIRP